MSDEAATRLDAFIDRYSPDVAATARDALARLRARLGWADVLVYDNYNALAIGFSPSDRAGEAFLSIALYPRWMNLFFLRGAELDDPAALLKGKGSRVRHVRLVAADLLERKEIEALVAATLDQAGLSPPPGRAGRLIVKSVSANQRPRRPAA